MTTLIIANQAVTPDALQAMTETQVDDLFAEAYGMRWNLVEKVARAWEALHRAVGDKRDYNSRRQGWKMTRSEAMTAARRSTTEETALAIGRLAQAEGAVEHLDELVAATLDTEYDRRGRWNRAFLVEGNNGHVHSSRACSTCNNGEYPTRFVWKTEYSGKTEEEIVDAAGERACTVCYPSAPVETLNRPTRMFGPAEIERQKAAEERAAKKAEKERQAIEKGITLPDGSPLRDEAPTERFPRAGSIVKTLVTAKREMSSELFWAERGGNSADRHEANARHLARAIAWKTNGLPVGTEPTDEQIEAVIAPVRVKRRKEIDKDRQEWEKNNPGQTWS